MSRASRVTVVVRHGHAVYRDPRWPGLRIAAKRRDDWRCRKCGARGLLEIDHVRPLRTHPELAYELTNLQTLCRTCHSSKTAAETGFAPLTPDRAQWRDLLRKGTPHVDLDENPKAAI